MVGVPVWLAVTPTGTSSGPVYRPPFEGPRGGREVTRGSSSRGLSRSHTEHSSGAFSRRLRVCCSCRLLLSGGTVTWAPGGGGRPSRHPSSGSCRASRGPRSAPCLGTSRHGGSRAGGPVGPGTQGSESQPQKTRGAAMSVLPGTPPPLYFTRAPTQSSWSCLLQQRGHSTRTGVRNATLRNAAPPLFAATSAV